ncbi:metallophosphoesterase family protein [Pendulispora albinea]|uniref:Metallophosphoesterase n=1 Tax=Pendulispora albinea TaxID=2741071 RepID=A0ABZ2LXM2_9BACT
MAGPLRQRIAHLSDVHVLEGRSNQSEYSLSTRVVSFHRRLDGEARALKMKHALDSAKRARADHIVISGDLTELGTSKQFERFAEVLHDAAVAPESVTLVPGNHDAYDSYDGWKRAMAGPLRAYAGSSAGEPGLVLDRGGFAILPIDACRHQSIARSGGELTNDAADALERRTSDPSLRKKATIVVLHHPPFGNAKNPWHFIDGLRGHARLLHLLEKHPNLHLLHGHRHRMVDRIVLGSKKNRVFGASATVDDAPGRPRVRLYEVCNDTLESVGLAA